MPCSKHCDHINGECYKKCPINYKRSKIDPTLCLLNRSCPVGSYLENETCVKNYVAPVNNLCDVDFQMWVPGQCFKNCPEPFLEGGKKCYFPETLSSLTHEHIHTDEYSILSLVVSIFFFWFFIVFVLWIVRSVVYKPAPPRPESPKLNLLV